MKTNTPSKISSSATQHTDEFQIQRQDEMLMRALKRRDPRAVKLLFQRYRLLFRAVILHVIHDESAADDVLQESILEIWRHADRYSPQKGRPLGWMAVVCKRRAIDHLRRCRAYSRACDRMESDMELKNHAWAPGSAGESAERSDLGAFLEKQVHALPAGQEQVIRLAFLNGMSQREVAHATDTPLGTVKTRIELGLKKLQASLRTKGLFDRSLLERSAVPA